jgi:hypothetical protein
VCSSDLTSNGITRIANADSVLAPPELVARIVTARWRGQALDLQRPLGELEGDRGSLELEFAALPLASARGLQFRYRLQGVDADWVTTTHADARYPGLRAGRYAFQLQAFDPQRQQYSPPLQLDFEVPLPWWQRAPVMACLALLGLVLLALLLRGLVGWRTRLLLNRQRMLERLVDQRTDELQRDKQALIEAREALRIQATHDGLTGVLNRAAIQEQLQNELERCRREGTPLAVLLADIDHFKRINDEHGHPAGDEVIREVAHRLGSALRPYDGVGRFGG